MATVVRWSVVLACPGEGELALLADLSARRDAHIVAVADPDGTSLGADLAEIMGIPVIHDLDGLNPGEVDWLVHPELSEPVAALVDEAEAKGIAAERADLFAVRLIAPGQPVPATPRPVATRDLEHLEKETANIHRTLSRIEEALDRESLLRWLLGLAMRAVGASSGSLMLWDEAAGELYVGFAHGLSDATRHLTRVKAGEGISGRVAATGEAARVRSRSKGKNRDRTDIIDAVCAPLRWDDRLLGVINLSSTADDGPMGTDALGVVNGLSHRLASLLNRFLAFQAVQDQEKIRALEEELCTVVGDTAEPRAFLGTWLAHYARAAGALEAALGLLTADGDLCVIAPDSVTYESPPETTKATVLATGMARVMRCSEGSAETVYHLPVGKGAQRAVLTLVFSGPEEAHRFGAMAATYIYLANRHLGPALTLGERTDEVERLTLLASALSSLAEMQSGEAEERVLSAARRLTGARQALLVDDRAPRADDPLADLKLEASRLLRQTGDEGWIATTLETGSEGEHHVLAVPLDTTRPLPGLLLVDKQRVHDLDAATFTETDARFARRLLPLLRTPRIQTTPVPVPVSDSGTDQVVGILKREMDRCDRYHTMLGVAAFRLDRSPSSLVVAELAAKLRSSDQVGCLDDGTVVVVVPEDIQSLHRLQTRVEALLGALTGASMVVRSSSTVYPGPASDPGELLSAATKGCG
ncbi:hypothetical protein DRQ50_06910 [bacterium]|nr:MAG: hypothetical protein DRQ50_06910 [bacterium]